MNPRNVCISSPFFWGFTRTIDLQNVFEREDIVRFILNELRAFLVRENLQDLVERLEDRIRLQGFHIHGEFHIENLKQTKSNEIIYVCSHD
jgi:hypothetical protein